MHKTIDLKQIFSTELSGVSQTMLSYINSKEPLVNDVAKYLLNAGGKRIRPILTILISKICSYNGNQHILLGAAVELIHAATLLHDDVIDESTTRRSKPTANFEWGNKASILVGDFLFSQSFKLMVESKSMEALKILSSASAVIAEGEVMQLAHLYKNSILSKEQYEEIAHSKTAALFSAASHVGAVIAEQSKEICDAAKEYGSVVGLIFQIKDDMLDYFADPNVVGKNIGDDLSQGNITLPIILAYNVASNADRQYIEDCFFKSNNRHSHLGDIIAILNKYSIEDLVLNYIDKLLEKARNNIAILPKSEQYTDYLHYILDYVSGRQY